jgi:outer membrane receptor protein involved in Fe transport
VIAGVRYDNIGQIEIPARALQSAGVRFTPIKGIEWSLDMRNLTDERTSTFTNSLGLQQRFPIGDAIFFPIPGRTVLLSLRIFSE